MVQRQSTSEHQAFQDGVNGQQAAGTNRFGQIREFVLFPHSNLREAIDLLGTSQDGRSTFQRREK